MCTFKTFNKICCLNSYILFGSVHCSRQSSKRNIYVVPVYHLNTGSQEPININLNQKQYVTITTIRLIINYLIFTIIRLIIVHKNYCRVNSNATSASACWRRHANDFATLRLERRMEQLAMSRNVVSCCTQPAGQGNNLS